MAYQDSGKFKIRTFGLVTRSEDQILKEEFVINHRIGIDDKSEPNHGNYDPFIVMEFIEEDRLFVNLFHNKTLMHYHFIYSIMDKKIEHQVISLKL